jgi:hypothetical protein
MDRGHAILDLAPSAAIRALHAGCPVAFLGTAGFIDNAHGMRAGVIARHLLPHAIDQTLVIPVEQGQEFLERAWRNPLGQGHRFNAFAWPVRKLTTNVHGQMRSRSHVPETIVNLTQKAPQRRSQLPNPFGIHAPSLQILVDSRVCTFR